MQQSPNTNLINPKVLRSARENQRMTQQQLADAIHCNKDTVSRWERGTSRRVRSHLRTPLCDKLRISWEKLTGPDFQAEDVSIHARTKVPIGRNVRASLQLVALRYDVRVHDVLELAPLLFVIAAERSLLWRKRRLEQIESALNEAKEIMLDNSGHLSGNIVARSVSAKDQLLEEEKSLNQRDVFGRSIRYEFWQEGDEGPFLHYIRELVKDLPDGAISKDSIDSFDGNMVGSYDIAQDTLEQCTGLSMDEEQDRVLIRYIRCGSIDLNECIRNKRDSNESDYRQWLSEEVERAKEESQRMLLEMFGSEALEAITSTVTDGEEASGKGVEK